MNSTRSAVTNLRFSFTVGGSGQCSSAKLPQGKIAASVASPLKLTAAHRGGYTTYIVGRSTPKTSNGISTIPTTFKLSPGDKVKGVMDIGFNYNHPTGGSGLFTVGDCSLTLMGFAKR